MFSYFRHPKFDLEALTRIGMGNGASLKLARGRERKYILRAASSTLCLTEAETSQHWHIKKQLLGWLFTVLPLLHPLAS